MTENLKVLVNELKESNRKSNEILEKLLQEFDDTEEKLNDESTTEDVSIVDRNMEMKRIVTRYLHQLGIPTHFKGFKYSRMAIMLCVQDKSYLETIRKRLYPEIAEFYNTTPNRVDRAIRYAIESIATIIDSEKCYELWGGRRPTNTEFLARMVEKYEIE